MISTRGRYALRVMVDLAEHGGAGFITLSEVAARQEISEKYLENIAKELVRAGYLQGLRGKGGGYRLARAPEDINVRDVLVTMEGTLSPVACLEKGAVPCDRAGDCRTLPLWQGLDKVIEDYLRGFTVRDLMHRDTDGFDYVI